MSKGPHTQTDLAESLEKWHAVRRERDVDLEKASWEDDNVFMGLALTLWPVDTEAASHGGYHAQSARMRLRLRWEGFRAAADVQQRLDALLATADYVREQMRPTVVPVRNVEPRRSPY